MRAAEESSAPKRGCRYIIVVIGAFPLSVRYEMKVYNHCYRLVINKHSYTRKYRVKHGRSHGVRNE